MVGRDGNVHVSKMMVAVPVIRVIPYQADNPVCRSSVSACSLTSADLILADADLAQSARR